MKKQVMLSISGRQYYPEQQPEVIELVTEGTLEYADGGWDIQYEESDLTGMAGVTTTFRLEPGQIILKRTGKLNSLMLFKEGVPHTSMYQMEFGSLMLSVCAKQIEASIDEKGGTVDLTYSIEIEQSDAGLVEYHLDVRTKE